MEEVRPRFTPSQTPNAIPSGVQRVRRPEPSASSAPPRGYSSTAGEQRKPKSLCSHCGDGGCGADCPRRNSIASPPQCALCSRPVTANADVRACSMCRKWSHADCDTDSIGGVAVEGEYVCPSCRNSPLVADAMMTSAGGGGSLVPSPSSVSAHEDASRGALLDNNYSMQSPANHNSPLVAHLDSSFSDIFSMSNAAGVGHGEVSAMSSPTTTTATTTASNSARASPAFYLENTPSSDNDDFRPPPKRERSEGSSHSTRGGRGNGKKKPGGLGRASNIKTRSAGGSGDVSDTGAASRGKRSSRGANKNGKGSRGRRTRGGKTCSMIAVVSAVAAARDAEGESSGAEEGRCHRGDENDYIRTVVVTASDNPFFSAMPLCLICGSIGRDAEGTMVTCATCAQSYHTYCVGLHDKLNTTIVKRGWRCLDCTVCEGCGEGRDESNLLLCDECDVSYHTYCLDPPLSRIPPRSWRCKWCATCRRCSKQIGSETDTQPMEGLCESCYSLRKCLKCHRLYELGDQIIKCQHCHRWLHGKCEDIFGDEMLEMAAENGFRCSLCRPQGSVTASDAINVLVCDNVTMNKCAVDVLHTRHGGVLFRSHSSIISDPNSGADTSAHSFAPRAHSFDEGFDEDEGDLFTSSVGTSGRGRGIRGGGPGRRVLKLGVGGFFVKMPRHRLSAADDDGGVEEETCQGQKPKLKRPRKPRRTQLEDNYPAIIQETFFGLKPVEGRNLLEVIVDEPRLEQEVNRTTLGAEKDREGCELNEADSEALREGESLLGDIENDLFGSIEEILENFDINELLMEGDEEEVDDAIDAANDGSLSASVDNGGARMSGGQGGQLQTQFSYQGNQGNSQQAKSGGGRSGEGSNSSSQGGFQQTPTQQMPAYPLQTNIQTQSGSRSNSQMDNCVERVNQATERWEEDEPLGERATKAAVLYANVNYPQWREQYPEWSERVKQIHRMWRSLDPNSRQEYVSKARENRANRAKQPKAKRIAAAALRAAVGSPKCSSPTRNAVASTPGQYYYQNQEMDGGMGTAGGGGPTTVRNPHVAVAHLSKEILDNYSLLHRRSNELAKYQQAIENDLARMRKQKKNLTAKRRQLNKNNQQVDAHGDRMEIELNDADKHSLATLISTIPNLQKDLEDCKRDIKQHSSIVRDFEVKNNIPPDLFPLPPPPAPVTPVATAPPSAMAPPAGAVRAPHPQQQMTSGAAHMQGGGMMSPGAVRPPPPYPTNSPMGAPGYPLRAAMQQYGGCNPGMVPHQPFVSPRMDNEQHSQMCSGPPTPSSGRPSSSASVDWQARGKGGNRKRRREEDSAPEVNRSPMLGNVAASSISTRLELDVYDVVDGLLTQAQIMVDGAEAARKSGMLKRLLESHPSRMYASQKASFGFDPPGEGDGGVGMRQGDGPKPKKKRTQQKKPLASTGNEQDMLLERISTQLRLCPPLPKRAIEPIPRIDRSAAVTSGVTDLPDRTDKPSIVGDAIGGMELVFMRDFYARMFECPIDEESLYPTMSVFSDQVNINALYQERCCSPSFSWREDFEPDGRFSKMDTLHVPRRSRSPPMRTISRIPEAIAPQPPHRSSFFKNHDLTREFEVSLLLEGEEEGFDPSVSFDQLMTLLRVNSRPEYQLDTPPRTPEVARPESREPHVKEEKPQEELHTCRHCGSLMDTVTVRQPARQLGIPANSEEEEVSFCSMSCYFAFVANAKVALSPDDLTKAERFVDGATLAKLRQISADNFAKCLHLGKVKSEGVTPPQVGTEDCASLADPRLSLTESDYRNRLQVIHVKELSVLNESTTQKNAEMRWKGHLWMHCDAALIESFQRLTNQKHMAIQLQSSERARGVTRAEDHRVCALCTERGDGEMDVAGRLINADANVWVHVNCAIWSQEVFESSSGALTNVEEALRRAAEVMCSLCEKPGASVRCYKLNCETHFHLPCAKKTKGKFMKDKTFVCELHDDVRPEMAAGGLEALRRIYVDREENQLIAKLFQSNDAPRLTLRVGTLLFHHIGQLLPEQLKAFHTPDYIFPIGYSVTRIFWSPFNVTERLRFECSIRESRGAAEFVISYEGGREIRDSSATEAWSRITMAVEQAREKAGGMLRLFASHSTGEALFGLTESAISKMTESLPGVDQLLTYSFKHGGSPLMDLPLAVNPSGCARCEPRFRTLIKHKHHRNPPTAASSSRSVGNTDVVSRDSRTRGGGNGFGSLDASTRAMLMATGMSLDAASSLYARFEPGQLHSSSLFSQYQKMKKEWKNSVYLARSRIQGLGLYASRDIDMNSMIIEYKGEVIRSEVGEMREKRYEAQNRGVYMFRIDDERLIDATMAGGPARYINHSCDPNCTTRIVASGPNGDDKKIIIIANRPISAGEELTYDYQFDIEDTADKIACLCGAPNCQKWMN